MNALVPFLVDTALKGSVVLVLAWGLAAALRRAAASTRYLVWASALACLIVLPLWSLLLPAWNVEAPLAEAQPIADVAPAGPPAAGVEAGTNRSAPAPWVALIWMAGAAAAGVRLLAGMARVRAFRRRARRLDAGEWAAAIEGAAEAAGLRRGARVLATPEVEVPLTCGLWRATVLLPETAGEWDAERRRIVLLHEFTHVRRGDHLAHLMAQAAAALYWFHPLAWLAVTRLRAEQERACDDAVLGAGTRGSAYAEHLLALARSLGRDRWGAAVGMAEGAHLETRMRALLDTRLKRGALTRRAALAAGCGVLAIGVPLAALHAQSSQPTATLSGTVFDPSRAVVPRATVRLTSLDSQRQEIAKCDAAGEFSFRQIPAGRYDLTVMAPGFAVLKRPGVTLAANSADRVELTLNVGQVSEAMDVVAERPASASARPSGTPHRIRVGGNVQATKLTRMVRPAYPEAARQAGIEGSVMLRAVISTSGDLLNLSVINTVDPTLAQAAEDAVRQWHYEPTLLNGQPVEVVTTITLNFSLR